jgi:large subunit ribosomal protein L25
MQVVSFSGNKRENLGKKHNVQLRKQGLVPAVLYGQGISESFSLTPKDIKGLVYTPDFKLANLSLEGKEYNCFIKDIQFHPVTDEILHVDFLSLTDGVPVNVKVPLRTVGVSEGVKLGGKLIQQIRKIDVRTTPDNMIDHVEVDISGLDLGDSVRVRDIKPVAGVEILNIPATPVAMVEIPRALRSASAAEEDGAAPAEAVEATEEA